MALTSLDLALGNSANKLLVINMLNDNSANDFVYDAYIDDSSWWGMFAMRGYQAYGNSSWIDNVRGLVEDNLAALDDTCGGGVRWLTYNYVDKNTITNT
jgi:hypothetical protein